MLMEVTEKISLRDGTGTEKRGVWGWGGVEMTVSLCNNFVISAVSDHVMFNPSGNIWQLLDEEKRPYRNPIINLKHSQEPCLCPSCISTSDLNQAVYRDGLISILTI